MGSWEHGSMTFQERGREMLGGVAERGRERLVEAADRGKAGLADRLSGGADYLRDNDVEVIRDDLVSGIRRQPMRSVAIAVGAGYLLGKVLSPPTPSFRKKKKGLGDQIGRAVVSTVAAVVAAKVQAGLLAETRQPPTRSRRRTTMPRQDRD
ncbi:MAG: hypothetical protein ACT4O1_14040 [Gemmatimonadota bacterium]